MKRGKKGGRERTEALWLFALFSLLNLTHEVQEEREGGGGTGQRNLHYGCRFLFFLS